MKRVEILRAAELTVESRGATHGPNLASSFEHVAKLWTSYLGMTVYAADVPAMMALLKFSRIKMGSHKHPDHYVDIAGYAALMGELNGKE